MGRSSIGWRRSATSNTVSNDNTEENYATCHREALARKSEEQKTRLAEEITKDVMDILHYGEEAVSVAIEEIERQDWAEKVYKPEILTSPEKLYKKPDLIDLVWNGKINPGKVFDLTLPLDQVAEGYRAMHERRAIKTLLRP